ncbi:MAG: ABC transporter permease [Streptococcaceae bacterium]|jgi:ABC-2 type transport system permease protein|nr:ABC transporter permease [Streptococcaceae bacterium]
MSLFDRKNRILLQELVKTDFKLRYQGSVIGHLWSILKPIMLFSVMYMVFIHFLRFGSDVPHFAVALLLGMVMWTFFQETTQMGLTSIVGRGDLLRKLSFPNEILVVSVSVNAMINFLINLIVVIAFALINGVDISKYAFLAPLLIIEMYLFSLGVAFILATFFVKFRDIAPIWEVVMQAGMYATPIIYPITMVTETNPRIAKLLMLNPLAQTIQDMRYLFISDKNMVVTQMLPLKYAFIPYVLPVVVFVLGYSIFKHNSRKFAEIL